MLNLPPGLRHSAVFLVEERASRFVPCATAFIVSVCQDDSNEGYSFLVTARHCLEQANKTARIFVRLNTESGFIDHPIPHIDGWLQHATNDVAILHFDLPADSVIAAIPHSMLLESDSETYLSEGDEVAFVSLFSPHPGTRRILPVLRTGRIALLPHELVHVQLGSRQSAEVSAYLIESYSWGGCSGAPTFVNCPSKSSDLRLMGLVNGHHELYREISGEPGVRVPLNAGMAIVVPSSCIIELLDAEMELNSDRKPSPISQVLMYTNVRREILKRE